MMLENGTTLPALAYDIVEKDDEYHVVVARVTYRLEPERGDLPAGAATHRAVRATEQRPLVVSDVYFGEMNRSSVKYESDLAPRKPKCDVIVIGAAHSPTGKPVEAIPVSVRVLREEGGAGLPGLLLEHRLVARGARSFVRDAAQGGWKVEAPQPFLSLPLRYEHAFGGELKVYPDDEAAGRLDASRRLDSTVRARHPEGDKAPLAHATSMQNPVGAGFLEEWYAKAAKVEKWPAPRIEHADAPLTPELFDSLVRGELHPGEAPALSPHGVGVVAKPWSPRLPLAGTFDEAWLSQRWPRMPLDFDMLFWNCASPGMQCEHLEGGERVELENMLPAGPQVPGARGGPTPCRFAIPHDLVALRVRQGNGALADWALAVDTVIIDLEEMRLSLVWRLTVPKDPELRVVTLVERPPESRAAEASAPREQPAM